jgi:hypothetical protein
VKVCPVQVGQVKGNLTVLSVRQKTGGWLALCRCSCGMEAEFQTSRITGYKSRFASCNINGHRWVNVRHGMSRTWPLRSPEHCLWVEMRQRCENPKQISFPNYGGRGIVVCERWQTFENFFADMGKRPPGMTIERINNSKGYEPSNCCWATRKEQARNRRSSRLLTFAGVTKTVAQWGEICPVNARALSVRINQLHWPIEKALTTPPMINKYAYR